MPNQASPSLSQAGPKFRDIAAQIFRLATVFAEHKITKTKAKLEKKSSSLQDPTALANHICP